MQKKLLTMAVAGALAAPVAAFADVTVYGTIDTGIASTSKIDDGTGNTESLLEVTNGRRTTNRLGFRGSEDLGGGLMANFTMEGQHDSDTGARALTTARKSIVGLSKGGNSVDLGRDYTVNFKSQGIYDPMSYTYTGITPAAGTNTAGVRSSNLVTAGFRFGTGGIRVDYALGEDLGNDFGNRIGVMGDFQFGPVTATAAFSSEEITTTEDETTTNIGGAYRMGPFTFRLGYSTTETEDPGGEIKSPLLLAGVQYAFSPTLNGRVGYYDLKVEQGAAEAKQKLFIVALDYYLSKRTTLYVNVDRITLDDNAEALSTGVLGARRDGSTGIGAGIAHAF